MNIVQDSDDHDPDNPDNMTEETKQQRVNENLFTGDRDVDSKENLPGTEHKATLTVPPGQTQGDMYLQRDYNWLEYFATEVGKVEHIVTQAREKLRAVEVKPGNFTQAHHIATTTDRLKTDYVANLDRIQNSIVVLVDRCHEVAKTYKNSDELNASKVDDLKGTFEQITAELGKLTSVSVKDK